METDKAPAYFKSNTGFRFISKGKNAFKLSIPKPEGRYIYRSIGYVRIGEEIALKKAIKERNRLGKQSWGKFWHSVVSDWTLLARLPKNLEPTLCKASDRKNETLEYRANWIERRDGELFKVSRRYSCTKHGKLGAYTLAKKAILHANKEKLALLQLMGRGPIVKMK
ncbi:Fe3+-citrate ABC transporter substrate-binding protein [Vibrio sp. CyArs1]|uniref:Fe3+-citrate ABC transporter substrate-binding protein n=1 Tax=Vibrio sp. CyArs1 TaxID=2682577 RepID=UPI001F06E251|nr:Fe3+-citrate ABC transporter substrate-binding protein [Vibrio sp. CyArs1]